MSRAYTAEEVRQQVYEHLRLMAKYWADLPGLEAHARTDGLVFSVLTMLDGSANLPVMDLVVRSSDEDKAYHMERGENFYADGTVINEDVMLHELYYDGQDPAESPFVKSTP